MRKSRNNNDVVIARVRARDEQLFLRSNQMRNSDRRLDGVFERLYFHEIDGRDKVLQRLQLPLVAFLALVGLLGHIAQTAQRSNLGAGLWMWLSFSVAALCLAGAFIFLFFQ